MNAPLQHQQQKQSANGDHGITGQTTDEEEKNDHHEDGHRQRPLAPLFITHVAPEDSADGKQAGMTARTPRRRSSRPRNDPRRGITPAR